MIRKKQVQLPINISQQQLDIKNNFNFIKLYMHDLKILYSLISPVKGNLIHVDIRFEAQKFGCLKYNISTNNALS